MSPRDDLRGLHALVVDDNETHRQIVERQLDSWAMQSTSAEGGERALELLRAAAARGEPYDVALLDMKMPGMDGLELGAQSAPSMRHCFRCSCLPLLPSAARQRSRAGRAYRRS